MIRALVRVLAYAALLTACAAAVGAALVTTWTALTQPTRTFVPTLSLTATAAYAIGRTRPLLRLYDRLDDATYRALRDWQQGDRVWTLAVRYFALHPFRSVAAMWRVKRKARTERREGPAVS